MGLRLDLSAHHGSGAPLGDPEGQERTGRGRVRQEGRGSAETGAAGMIEIFREIFGAFWAFGRSRIFKYFGVFGFLNWTTIALLVGLIGSAVGYHYYQLGVNFDRGYALAEDHCRTQAIEAKEEARKAQRDLAYRLHTKLEKERQLWERT